MNLCAKRGRPEKLEKPDIAFPEFQPHILSNRAPARKVALESDAPSFVCAGPAGEISERRTLGCVPYMHVL